MKNMKKPKKIKLVFYQTREFLKAFFRSKKGDEQASFRLLETFGSWIYPKYRFSEFGRIWLEDKEFFRRYEKYNKNNYHSADRKFFLKSILLLVKNLPGDTAECGTYEGASSEFICESIKDLGKKTSYF